MDPPEREPGGSPNRKRNGHTRTSGSGKVLLFAGNHWGKNPVFIIPQGKGHLSLPPHPCIPGPLLPTIPVIRIWMYSSCPQWLFHANSVPEENKRLLDFPFFCHKGPESFQGDKTPRKVHFNDITPLFHWLFCQKSVLSISPFRINQQDIRNSLQIFGILGKCFNKGSVPNINLFKVRYSFFLPVSGKKILRQNHQFLFI